MFVRRFSVIATAMLVGCGPQNLDSNAAPAEIHTENPEEEAAPSSSEKEMKPVSNDTDTATHEHTNRLIDETSPYLIQHAHNPVDWYPWGPEAFERARSEDKPIFLSVGYSSCHWCHVMEHESFENEDIAAVLNEHFVSIKVDREERPDVDEIYMTAVQAMTQQGGWPMSVFLTPELEPFFGGTYFPPEDRYGRPGFKKVLLHIAKTWEDKRAEIEAGADELSGHMRKILSGAPADGGNLDPGLISAAADELVAQFDSVYGGFGRAPKFPSSPSIAVLLREYNRTGDSKYLSAATHTLDRMATGGIYDHLGGGFARYSVDDQWLVPHFEKMLYDNAQLAVAYIEAFQVTHDPFYRQVVEETLAYVMRDMTDERGGFYSAEDADSEGEEGKFYIWRHEDILAALDTKPAERFIAYYNVKPEGNFRSTDEYHAGQNILHTPRPIEDVAADFGESVDEFRESLQAAETRLLAVRNERTRPGLDDKVLSAWNGLMISGFAKAYQVFRHEDHRRAAQRAAGFVLDEMTDNGMMYRTYRNGESKLPGYLDDYAFVVAGLIDLYEATFDVRWLNAAENLTESMIERFWDDEHAGFFFTGDEHKNLLVRTRPAYDGAIPSGNSVAALNLLRLAKLLDNQDYYNCAESLLELHRTNMRRIPRGHLTMLTAADFYLYPPKEIAIAGDPQASGTIELLSIVHTQFVPNKVLALLDPQAGNADALESRMPLLAMKEPVDGKSAAYVCQNFACKQPVTEPAALAAQLGLTDE